MKHCTTEKKATYSSWNMIALESKRLLQYTRHIRSYRCYSIPDIF